MRVLISGSSGLVGSALVARLHQEHGEPVRLVRRLGEHPEPEVVWQPTGGAMNAEDVADIDAVVNLAGENISDGRWTEEKKQRIYGSRVEGTRLLCETLARVADPPRVLVSASAIGFYGDRGKQVLDEDSSMGEGFLAEVCQDWEAATQPAVEAGIRVVNLRIGLVLSAHGGALARMITPFKFGLGGPIGRGDQYMSWITLDDLVSAILYSVHNKDLSGPVNGLSPDPVTNKAFTRALASVVHRPAVFRVPSFAIKTALGEMGESLLLSSTRALPQRLLDSGFNFAHPDIETALEALVG